MTHTDHQLTIEVTNCILAEMQHSHDKKAGYIAKVNNRDKLVSLRNRVLDKTQLSHDEKARRRTEKLDDFLYQAIFLFDTSDIIVSLFLAGADVNAEDADRARPLHRAAALGKAEICATLFRLGAIIDAKDKHGRTPLDYAIYHGRSDVVAIILEILSPPKS